MYLACIYTMRVVACIIWLEYVSFTWIDNIAGFAEATRRQPRL